MRRFTLPRPGYSHGTPKAGALPTALHPVIEFFIRLGVFSQTRRDTNFAIPGYSLFCHDTTANGKNKVFSVCGHLCGQSRFCAVFGNRGKTRYCPCCKALRRFTLPYPGYNHGTPKPPALPTAPHPVVLFYFILLHFLTFCFQSARFPQKHSRATRDPEKACLFGERTRGVMNKFSPKAETNDMEQPRTMKRSLRSLFLHLGAMPSSATGGGIPPRPTAPHPVVLFYFILLHLLTFCFQSARFPQKHSRGSSSDRGTDSARAVQIYP